jgi:hypothetical protein
VGTQVGATPQEDPASSYAAAARAFNEGRINAARYAELKATFGVRSR